MHNGRVVWQQAAHMGLETGSWEPVTHVTSRGLEIAHSLNLWTLPLVTCFSQHGSAFWTSTNNTTNRRPSITHLNLRGDSFIENITYPLPTTSIMNLLLCLVLLVNLKEFRVTWSMGLWTCLFGITLAILIEVGRTILIECWTFSWVFLDCIELEKRAENSLINPCFIFLIDVMGPCLTHDRLYLFLFLVAFVRVFCHSRKKRK